MRSTNVIRGLNGRKKCVQVAPVVFILVGFLFDTSRKSSANIGDGPFVELPESSQKRRNMGFLIFHVRVNTHIVVIDLDVRKITAGCGNAHLTKDIKGHAGEAVGVTGLVVECKALLVLIEGRPDIPGVS